MFSYGEPERQTNVSLFIWDNPAYSTQLSYQKHKKILLHQPGALPLALGIYNKYMKTKLVYKLRLITTQYNLTQ